MDGLKTALERIVEEAKAQTGALNLAGLEIEVLPEALFELTHLTSLTLGSWENPFSSSPLKSLKGVDQLTKLTELDCTNTKIEAIDPVKTLTKLTKLYCSGTEINTLDPVKTLTKLTELDCSHTQIKTLDPVKTLTKLTKLDCSRTEIKTLDPVKTLTQLTELDCSRTEIETLDPVKTLTQLTQLDCSRTEIETLDPVKTLTKLTQLNCSGTQIKTLDPVKTLTKLTELHCSNTQIKTLNPVKTLTKLTKLYCSGPRIETLDPVKTLTQLTQLDCSETPIKTLDPVKTLTKLTKLHCPHTQINTLDPVKTLTKLTRLSCSHTQIKTLQSLENAKSMRYLTANYLTLKERDLHIFTRLDVGSLYLYNTQLDGVPTEVLSQSSHDNCSEQLRSHIIDLGDEPEPLNHVKALILGNGRVGKTQLVRNLRNLDFEAASDSTHGIEFQNVLLSDGDDQKVFKFWDFGGQDIYHGTHALFVKGRGVFVIVWNKVSENTPTHIHEGQSYKNERLNYWVKFIEHLAGVENPLIIVQSHCEDPKNDVEAPPIDNEILTNFSSVKAINFGAETGRGKEELKRYLIEAAEELPQILIGTGRLIVKNKLEKMKAACLTSVSAPKYLSFSDFEALCHEAGNISNAEVFARYLHNCDVIFYQKNIFDNRIIIDPAWAFEAIYSIFNRAESFKPLKDMKGRFTRAFLGAILWDGNHPPNEQRLFIEMMVSCGMCFALSPHYTRETESIEYIAPDLLPPDRPDVKLLGRWDDNDPTEILDIDLPLMSPSVLRTIMSDMGADAGIAGLYWKTGFYLYETHLKSHGIIESIEGEEFAGVIRIRTQKGRADAFKNHLHKRIDKIIQKMGLTTTTPYNNSEGDKAELNRDGISPREKPSEPSLDPLEPPTVSLKFGFEKETGSALEAYVSYAWNDDKSEAGKKREENVDLLMARAESKGILIKRDKEVLATGDNLKQFMTDLSQGGRIFIFLSDKYLKSTACMYELFHIWLWSQASEDNFLKTVRVFKLDADIFRASNRMKYVDFWRQEYEALKPRIEKNLSGTSPETLEEFQLMQQFYLKIDHILKVIANTVLERDFDKFVSEGFEGLMEH